MAHLATFSGQSSAALTASCSCTIPAEATYCLIFVGMRGGDGGATTLSSATLGAQVFTLNPTTLRRFDSFQAMQAGYILAADMPSGTVTATATRTVATNGMALSVSFFDGAVQAAPTAQPAGDGAGGDPFNTDITVSAASILVDGIVTSNALATFSTNQVNQTERASETVTGNSVLFRSSTRPVSSGTQTMGWDTGGNSQRTSHIVLALEDAAAGPSIAPSDPAVDGAEATITTSGLTGDITAALGGYSLSLSGTLPNLTYTLDIASITDNGPVSAPRIGESLTLSVTGDEGEATSTVDFDPAAGYAAITLAGTLANETDSLIDGMQTASGLTVAVGDIMYYPTADTTSIAATGALTTDSESFTLILIQGGSATTAGNAYAFTVTPEAVTPVDPPGESDNTPVKKVKGVKMKAGPISSGKVSARKLSS